MRRVVAILIAAVIAPLAPVGALEEADVRLGVGYRSAGVIDLVRELASERDLSVRVPFASNDLPQDVPAKADAVEAAAIRGYHTIVSLRYRPGPSTPGPEAFASWAAEMAERFKDHPNVAFDVTNRINAPVPDPGSDAAGPGALEAMLAGIAAVREAAPDAPVGFSLLATGVEAHDLAWWGLLAARAPGLGAELGFIGAQLYPGTWSPSGSPEENPDAGEMASSALRTMRRAARTFGFSRDIPMWVTEIGFPVLEQHPPVFLAPTDVQWAGRTAEAQAAVLEDILDAIGVVARAANIETALWAELIDPYPCSASLCDGAVAFDRTRRPAYDVIYFAQRSR